MSASITLLDENHIIWSYRVMVICMCSFKITFVKFLLRFPNVKVYLAVTNPLKLREKEM